MYVLTFANILISNDIKCKVKCFLGTYCLPSKVFKCNFFLQILAPIHFIFMYLDLLHNSLTFFLQMYVICSVMLFSLSKFIDDYNVKYRIYLLPFLLPLAHIGLMGSVYSTLALTIERFLAVCHPFLKHR